MGIEIKGFEQLQTNLETFKKDAKDILVDAIFYGETLIANDARQGHDLTAHDKGRYQDRTGNLTNSIKEIKPEVTATSISGKVVALMEYAAVVELGGTHSENGRSWRSNPYPYMFPAFEKYKKVIYDSLYKMLKTIKWVK
jgi:hypothetical protein